jgi:hypothetical protein
MVRIGGDRICEIALTAASNMAVLPLVKKPSRQVDTPKGFGKGFDKSLPAQGKQDRRQKQEVVMTRIQEHYPDSNIVPREVGLRSGYSRVIRSRNALPTTLTDDSAIAAAAMIGDSKRPNAG